MGSAWMRGEPGGRVRQQVERDGVGGVRRVGVERLADDVLRLQLRVGVGEAHLDAVGVEEQSRWAAMPAVFSASSTRAEQRGVDLERGLAAGHLHRRRFAEEVRQRVQRARAPARTAMSDVDPERVAVHWIVRTRKVRGRLRRLTAHDIDLIVPLGSRVCTAAFCTCTSVSGGDLEGDVGLADLGDLAQHAARGDRLRRPFAAPRSSALCSLARFICGRIMQEIQQREHQDDDA